jgi:hypothetical protein
MNEQKLVNENGEEQTIVFSDLPIKVDYELGQKVWFYLPNSIEVNSGKVVGFFLTMQDKKDDDARLYYYQVEYYVEMKDGSKSMRLGNVTSEEMGIDEKEIKERFEPIREKRIEAAIRQGEVELGGAMANKKEHGDNAKEIEKEIKRLRALKR